MRFVTPSILRPLFFFLILFAGCSAPGPSTVTLTGAHQKFLKLCNEEYNLPVVTQVLENTLWIYLPLEANLFDFVADDKGPITASESEDAPIVNFLDGRFEDDVFKIQYDITLSKKYAKTFGYTTAYSKEYAAQQRKILTALSRSYFEVEKKDEIKKIPEFVGLIIADIVRGMETKMIFTFQDLKRGMMDPSFHEEYTRRFVLEDTVGHVDIKGDKEGNHVEFQEITWPVFLSKQMLYRIRVKYQRSNFPPSKDTKTEILKIVNRTVEAYDFTDFDSVELTDRDADIVHTVVRFELGRYKEELPAKGKLHKIKFVY